MLSPLLFLIFSSEAVEYMRSVQLDEGAVLLGAVSAVILLLADGTALIGRSLGDAQKLFDAFGRFCDKYHAEISTPKTKALCFRSDSSSMKLAESSMYRRVRYESRSAATHFFERLLRRGNGLQVFAWEPQEKKKKKEKK